MNKHKWNKEIKAWADGAEIEQMHKINTDGKWEMFNGAWGDFKSGWKFRIKPQQQQSSCCPCKQTCSALKEPQYLYVFETENGIEIGKAGQITRVKTFNAKYKYIGKIKLEDEASSSGE